MSTTAGAGVEAAGRLSVPVSVSVRSTGTAMRPASVAENVGGSTDAAPQPASATASAAQSALTTRGEESDRAWR
jgi:hypothetical protein